LFILDISGLDLTIEPGFYGRIVAEFWRIHKQEADLKVVLSNEQANSWKRMKLHTVISSCSSVEEATAASYDD